MFTLTAKSYMPSLVLFFSIPGCPKLTTFTMFGNLYPLLVRACRRHQDSSHLFRFLFLLFSATGFPGLLVSWTSLSPPLKKHVVTSTVESFRHTRNVFFWYLRLDACEGLVPCHPSPTPPHKSFSVFPGRFLKSPVLLPVSSLFEKN